MILKLDKYFEELLNLSVNQNRPNNFWFFDPDKNNVILFLKVYPFLYLNISQERDPCVSFSLLFDNEFQDMNYFSSISYDYVNFKYRYQIFTLPIKKLRNKYGRI